MSIADHVKHFRWWHEAVLFGLLVALLVVAGGLMPEFLTWRSQLGLSSRMWEVAILALGMTLIIITAGIDLSVGATMGLCAVGFGICYEATQSIAACCLIALTLGAACGAVNGLLISWVRVHPLIVTLAAYAAYRGIAEGVSQGATYSPFSEGFSKLARGTWWGVPIPGYIFAFLALGFAAFLAWTPGGRFLYAIGHNEEASRFSGIAVDRIKFRLYTLSGLLAGFASIIYVSRFNAANADAGKGFELEVITAVIIGGTSIFGGRGNIVGTVLGLLLIHETRLFVSRYWRIDELRSIVIGCLLIVSVLVYRLVMRTNRE